MIDRRRWSAGVLGLLVLPEVAGAADAQPVATSATQPAGANILRVPFVIAETGFDPVQISDLYSRNVTANIFEALYTYDLLADPVKVRPLTAAALPEISADFRVWTIRLQPGIFFADDPAFKGRRRELVAADYVYALKRFYDPRWNSPEFSAIDEEAIEGLRGLREAALQQRRPFDYDVPVVGLRALDRHTLQIRLTAPRPRFLNRLCESALYGAVAREVVEAYGSEIPAHPVGTGPYRLKSWRRSSRIELEPNPGFRELRYDAEPAADDVEGQAWLARFKGRRLPLNDGVEIAVLTEAQSRWLSFLNGQIDYVRVPNEFGDIATPNAALAPNLAKRGIRMRRYLNADVTFSFFNMDDPVVGGYTPEKVALRRAIELAYDIDTEIRVVRRGQAVAAQAPMQPGTFGYDPRYKSNNSDHDPARAQGLLDTYGYVDRSGDGWRDLPDGRPLVLTFATQASQSDRQFNEIWQKSLTAVGLRIRFVTAQWPENLKSARAGRLQMWSLAQTANSPDGQPALEYLFGPSIGSTNLARFSLPAFDALYRRMQLLPDNPERAALFIQASQLASAWMPYRFHASRIYTDLSQPWITGWRQGLFRYENWAAVEVDVALRDRMKR